MERKAQPSMESLKTRQTPAWAQWASFLELSLALKSQYFSFVFKYICPGQEEMGGYFFTCLGFLKYSQQEEGDSNVILAGLPEFLPDPVDAFLRGRY